MHTHFSRTMAIKNNGKVSGKCVARSEAEYCQWRGWPMVTLPDGAYWCRTKRLLGTWIIKKFLFRPLRWVRFFRLGWQIASAALINDECPPLCKFLPGISLHMDFPKQKLRFLSHHDHISYVIASLIEWMSTQFFSVG